MRHRAASMLRFRSPDEYRNEECDRTRVEHLIYGIRLRRDRGQLTRSAGGLHVSSKRFSGFSLVLFFVLLSAGAPASPWSVTFSAAPSRVQVFDYVVISATVDAPDVHNPFVGATLTGTLETADGHQHWNVEGFCDSSDGSIFRIRFMSMQAGSYMYSLSYRQGGFERTAAGTFQAVDAHRRGILRIDPQYPWHFIWAGTGEHFSFNGTTAYWFSALTGEKIDLPPVEGSSWTSPKAPDQDDWALLLKAGRQ